MCPCSLYALSSWVRVSRIIVVNTLSVSPVITYSALLDVLGKEKKKAIAGS